MKRGCDFVWITNNVAMKETRCMVFSTNNTAMKRGCDFVYILNNAAMNRDSTSVTYR
jgi:hypothetical protein